MMFRGSKCCKPNMGIILASHKFFVGPFIEGATVVTQKANKLEKDIKNEDITT